MAGTAQRDQVLPAVVAAFGQRLDVVYLLCLHHLSLLEAQLTERMQLNVPIADAFPCPSIAALGFRVSLVFFIAPVLLLLMLRAEAAIRQVGAAGCSAGTLGFVGHFHSPWA